MQAHDSRHPFQTVAAIAFNGLRTSHMPPFIITNEIRQLLETVERSPKATDELTALLKSGSREKLMNQYLRPATALGLVQIDDERVVTITQSGFAVIRSINF